jgi:exopolyphosphatase/guanosine-5'-triphosphate,3'-diphosphate pyrophosphatase
MRRRKPDQDRAERYAALDLGTNNCRLLIAAPRGKALRVVDSYSKIVRLGEGLSLTGALSVPAMERALEALLICAEKIEKRNVSHQRCIATQACRSASNGAEFLELVRERTGLVLEAITPEEEARLAAKGCSALFDPGAPAVLIFDIGGGSTEISLMRRGAAPAKPVRAAWTSLPFGVVGLSEKYGGQEISQETFDKIVREVRSELRKFGDPDGLKKYFTTNEAHLLGASGTVTAIAGVFLKLSKYRREKVDGLWMSVEDARSVANKLRIMTNEERAEEPCIGRERADLVVCGCAILEALAREWPASRIRVADRGLREGVLAELAQKARRQRRLGRAKKRAFSPLNGPEHG